MSQPPRQAQSPAAAAALPIVERLRTTIDAENRDLEQGRRAKYEAYSQSKNQGLLELSRSFRRSWRNASWSRCAMRWLNFTPSWNHRRALAMQLKACEAVSDHHPRHPGRPI